MLAIGLDYARGFNPRAPRGARQSPRCSCSPTAGFNPRAPRGARRALSAFCFRIASCFNPRAPRGARRCPWGRGNIPREFQSTRPARGATSGRPPQALTGRVSIHAPREGRDVLGSPPSRWNLFQSTRPARGATITEKHRERDREVSIHAPREGRDLYALAVFRHVRVSIHAPREGRDARVIGIRIDESVFQSTRPAWGATKVRTRAYRNDGFNPRAPRGARRWPSVLREWA